MARMIGFMATWTTYGTWLQGDKRGYVKNGTVLEANAELEKHNKKLLQHIEVNTPKHLRSTVKNAILQEAKELGQKVYAIAVCNNHVHIIVESIGKRCWYSVGRFKRAATKALKECGFSNILWTKEFDKRYCYHQHELDTKIKYVQRHKS